MSDQNDSDNQWAGFLYRLVHDLREPLREINTFAQVLNKTSGESLDPEASESLRHIASGVAKLHDFTHALGGYSVALEHPAEGAKSSLRLAFNMARASLEKQIQATGATVTATDLPQVGVGLERLAQLFENLIGNSLRFRGEAAPVVKVSAGPDQTGLWLIQVKDNGIGIDAADCESVFEPFVRLAGRKYPGTGLGLAVCRRIVENHGGTIRLAPNPDGGTVCSFTLPEA